MNGKHEFFFHSGSHLIFFSSVPGWFFNYLLVDIVTLKSLGEGEEDGQLGPIKACCTSLINVDGGISPFLLLLSISISGHKSVMLSHSQESRMFNFHMYRQRNNAIFYAAALQETVYSWFSLLVQCHKRSRRRGNDVDNLKGGGLQGKWWLVVMGLGTPCLGNRHGGNGGRDDDAVPPPSLLAPPPWILIFPGLD